MTDTPPDWVLIEAAKRWGTFIPEHDRAFYARHGGFRALCDMIAKHEQPPVDRKVLCAREAMRDGSNGKIWSKEEVGARAIVLWEEGFGK